jgi:hypothetical protein
MRLGSTSPSVSCPRITRIDAKLLKEFEFLNHSCNSRHSRVKADVANISRFEWKH